MDKIKAFWQKYEYKLILSIGLVLVGALAFQAGYIKGKSVPENPIIIEKTTDCPQNLTSSQNNSISPKKDTSAQNNSVLPQNCAFVGSKNSNKYHLPTCQWAKRIKPENIVCFASAEEATQKGYQPDKGCVK